ncbi:MAG: hypothetical protein CL424_13690 [Acidimicrobiaceae bacterium]|nr:hypothetical protein [Acidimicrobiaceae bacterium]
MPSLPARSWCLELRSSPALSSSALPSFQTARWSMKSSSAQRWMTERWSYRVSLLTLTRQIRTPT